MSGHALRTPSYPPDRARIPVAAPGRILEAA